MPFFACLPRFVSSSFCICARAFRAMPELLFMMLARVILSLPYFCRIVSSAASSFRWRSLFSVFSNKDNCSYSGVIGAPAAEAARAYRAYTLESDGIEDESNWFLPSSGQMLLMYRYRDKINEMMRTFWSSDSMLMTDKYYWSSTIWDTNSAWTFELNTGRITNQNKNSALLHVRAVASE